MPIQIKCAVIYIFSSILIRGVSLITTPLFTRLMSTSDMGSVTAFSSWQSILATIVTLSLSSGSFSVAMIEYKDRRDEYISSIMTLSSVSASIFFCIYLLFRSKFNLIFNLDFSLMVLMCLGFLLSPATTYWLLRQRFEYKYKNVMVVTFLSTILSTILSIIAVLYAKNYGVQNLGNVRLYGINIPSFAVSLVIFYKILKKGKVFYNKYYWRFALSLSLPLVIHSLSKHILDVSDRIMIDKFLGKSELGIYGVLYTISSLSIIFWSAINSSLIPVTFEKLKNKEFDRINELMVPIIMVYAIGCAILSLFSPEIVKILATEEYYSAIYLMPPIAAGIFLTSIYTIYGNILTFYKKTTSIMISTFLAAGINILLNNYYIPKYGAIAASYTTLIAYIFLTIFQMIAVKKVQNNTIINGKFLQIMILGTILWALGCNFLYQKIEFRIVIIIFIILLCIIKRTVIAKNIKLLFIKRRENEKF